MENNELLMVGDQLIDINIVKERRVVQMNKTIFIYKNANTFLGYCSQLREYSIVFETLTTKLMLYRREILKRYKDLLLEKNVKLFKAMLIPPTKTYWYIRGINQHKQMRKYCIWFYKQKIQFAIDANDKKSICNYIDTIIKIDKHYDIYVELIEYFINNNETFAEIMNDKYMSYIQL